MRTRQCKLIAKAECVVVVPITIHLPEDMIKLWGGDRIVSYRNELDAFAMTDGFRDWEDMYAFWRDEHGADATFEGEMIMWGPLL